MLTFSKEQMKQFERIEVNAFRRHMIERLSAFEDRFPENPEQTTDHALRFCDSAGLMGRDSIMGCGLLMMAYGPTDFMSHPSTRNIRNVSAPEFVRKSEIHGLLVALDSTENV